MNQKILLRSSAIVMALSGMVILLGVLYPILNYNSLSENTSSLLSPLAKKPDSALGNSINLENKDYTKASTWFVGGAKQNAFVSQSVFFYNISIPKLKIENATVAIGGEDLATSLIQYPGTALPGKKGNAVIFGHSILPIFYNPKNYISIFSTLSSLSKGDEVKINYDGVDYTYQVEDKFEVLPEDIQVLDQNSSDSFLTLVTCVPPGDPRTPKRLIVRARIVALKN